MDEEVNQFFEFAMNHNLNEIVRFYNFTRAQFAEFAETTDDNYERSTLDNYGRYVAANSFLMAYAFLEEYLYLRWRDAGQPERGRAHSLNRYETLLTSLGVSLDDPTWEFLKKATTIRHCLLHANGRLSFMTNPPAHVVRAIAKENPDGISIEHNDRIRIHSPYVSVVVTKIREFMDQSRNGT